MFIVIMGNIKEEKRRNLPHDGSGICSLFGRFNSIDHSQQILKRSVDNFNRDVSNIDIGDVSTIGKTSYLF